MKYIYERGKGRRVMHIQRFTESGQPLMEALCGIGHRFDTTINAPFGLGRKICRNCSKVASQ